MGDVWVLRNSAIIANPEDHNNTITLRFTYTSKREEGFLSLSLVLQRLQYPEGSFTSPLISGGWKLGPALLAVAAAGDAADDGVITSVAAAGGAALAAGVATLIVADAGVVELPTTVLVLPTSVVNAAAPVAFAVALSVAVAPLSSAMSETSDLLSVAMLLAAVAAYDLE
ncbi:hypothetical protein FPV67DRAFT_1662407 [Lyophyllum atratum]|nr:hypothetical protein FPV67DRAFT_1662407 [Lyophyllum atratum]